VAVAGGGTGGHVTMALALGEALVERGVEPLFVGSARGREARAVPAEGFRLALLPAAPLAGRSLWGRVSGGLALARGVFAARRLLARERVKAVLSVGGYAAAPAAAGALFARKPLFLVEPNAIPGRLHRALASRARVVFTAFASTGAALKTPEACVQVVGAPLRKGLVERLQRATGAPREPGPLRVLVVGGSQGARQLNDALIEAIPHLERDALDILHQTGDADLDRVAAAYVRGGLRARAFAFESDLGPLYHWADVALCRAGALTLAELALAGLPALLVPYPYAADHHQRANALEFERAGAGVLLEGDALGGEALANRLRDHARTLETLADMARSAFTLARPDAGERVVAAVLESISP
jgi:UDP-N-acetylglucosamine--N-acetylmuramyl-(pentapeptide) pyrophosphoryl-undecaprenol N-acetylglucosamine transferase